MYFSYKKKNAVNLPHSAHTKHGIWGGKKQIYKSKKIAHRKKFALELLHHILEHISTRSLMAVNNANIWQGIELCIDPDPF